MILRRTPAAPVLFAALAGCQSQPPAGDVDAFLADYNELYRELWTKAEGARWDAGVDIGEETGAAQVAAEEEYAARLGSAELIEQAQAFLERDDLSYVQKAQLRYVLQNAAKFPGTIPETTTALIQAGAAQTGRLYSYESSGS
mgnify:CR=1 FL=1